jgi:radical SAM superfamily enzyme YgiQ (UPF0313 family)
MKIALIRVKYKSYIITPPLGIGYLSAYAKKYGHDVLIIDALRDNLSNEDVLKIVNDNGIEHVGITCLSAFFQEVIELSQLMKAHNKKVFIGGVHPTYMPKETLEKTGADYITLGEGEIALRKLLDANFDGTGIQGVYSLENLPENPVKAERIEDFENDLPMPDWEQISPMSYPRAPHGAITKNYPIGIIMSTRGCPYGCKFCASPNFYGRSIRFRNPTEVVDEIEYLVKNHGVKEIHFEDDNFTLKREHAAEICRQIIDRKLKITFTCPNGIRADKVDKDLILLMKKAGCYSFAYGVESANPTILKNINKGEDIELIKKSIDIAAECGIDTQAFFIFGLPGETKDTIEETINFAIKSKLAKAQFLILDVLPGCDLYQELKGQYTSDFTKESYCSPEYIPEGLTKEDLIQAQERAMRKFYFRPKIMLNMLKNMTLSQIGFILKRLLTFGLIKKR